jgi:hypothetical protein
MHTRSFYAATVLPHSPFKRCQREALLDTGRAVGTLVHTSVLFQLAGRSAVARQVRRAMQVQCSSMSEVDAACVWRCFRAVERVTRWWPVPVRCLQTALMLHAVLRARGVGASVHLGVRRADTDLTAHAWIEVGPYVLDRSQVHHNFQTLKGVPAMQFAPESQ